MPPDRMRYGWRASRSPSIFSSSTCAITLRAVLAWQTTRRCCSRALIPPRSSLGVGQRAVVRVPLPHPLAQHGAELRPHGIDAAHGHGPAADGEVVRSQLAAANEVPRRRVRAPLAMEPLAEAELRARLLIGLAGQALELARGGAG